MGKTAVIFPGQGAQYVGMAKDFYDSFEDSKKVFDEADDVLDIELKKICFEENDDINKTEYTQPAMVAAEVAIYEHLKNAGLKADVFAGLSLGEYSALVAAGAMTLADGIKTVRRRGILMQNEVPLGMGGMAAVIAMDADKIAEICENTPGKVQIANSNFAKSSTVAIFILFTSLLIFFMKPVRVLPGPTSINVSTPSAIMFSIVCCHLTDEYTCLFRSSFTLAASVISSASALQ